MQSIGISFLTISISKSNLNSLKIDHRIADLYRAISDATFNHRSRGRPVKSVGETR